MTSIQPNAQTYMTRADGRLSPQGVGLLQRMATRIEALDAQNATQAAQIADLLARVEALEP